MTELCIKEVLQRSTCCATEGLTAFGEQTATSHRGKSRSTQRQLGRRRPLSLQNAPRESAALTHFNYLCRSSELATKTQKFFRARRPRLVLLCGTVAAGCAARAMRATTQASRDVATPALRRIHLDRRLSLSQTAERCAHDLIAGQQSPQLPGAERQSAHERRESRWNQK
jgi:hypothetical protein